MATRTITAPRITRVAVHPAFGRRRALPRRTRARRTAAAFQAHPGLNLNFFGGKTIEHLTFTHVYLGGQGGVERGRHRSDRPRAARRDAGPAPEQRARAVLRRRQADDRVQAVADPRGPAAARSSTATRSSRSSRRSTARTACPVSISRSSVFCFLLPRGVVLVDGDSGGHAEHDGRRRRRRAAGQPGAPRAERGRRLQARARRLPRLDPPAAARRPRPSTTRSASTPRATTASSRSTSRGRASARPSTTSSARRGPTRTSRTRSSSATRPPPTS